MNNGGCQQLCLPTGRTTSVCACAVGYMTNHDGTCSQSESFLLLSFGSVIRGFTASRRDHDDAIVPIGGAGKIVYMYSIGTP